MHAAEAPAIRARLAEFRAVPASRYFYELCYCLMTPQTSAVQCAKVAEELERRQFFDAPFDPEALLRDFEGGYVRFHRRKAGRLLAVRQAFPTLAPILAGGRHSKEIRADLVHAVNGLGLKEGSHFLRNIGFTELTIIDRHIIRNLLRLGVLDEWPESISPRRYLAIEALFEKLAAELGIPADELDLLLWGRETGFILK